MIPLQRMAARAHSAQLRLLTRSSRPAQGLRSLHSKLQPRPLNSRLAERVQHPESRVAAQLPHKPVSHTLRSSIFGRLPRIAPPGDLTPLQSRFPTKTVIFLIAVGGFIYWLIDVEVAFRDDIVARLYTVFEGDITSFPLHCAKDRNQVEHFIKEHMLDYADPSIKEPGFEEYISAEFLRHSGWTLGEENPDGSGIVDEDFGAGQREAEAVGMGGVRTHGCRFTSNTPCEDYFAIGSSPGPGGTLWNFWGVYDGHAGKHTAQWLQWALIPNVSYALSDLPLSSPSTTVSSTIMKAFLNLDANMMARAKQIASWQPAASAAAITALTPAYSGSCALLSMYDPQTSTLRVACTGDSRAVLGRWDPDTQSYICKPLSEDQTGFVPSEVERITAEHPGEENIIDPKSGRLLGIAVTRAFGDHRWKWDNDFIKSLQFKFWGSAPRPGNQTPPYMTAEPVVTETEIVTVDPVAEKAASPSGITRKSDFMIMASDGLWDRISSSDAVLLVEKWLEARERGNGSVQRDPKFTPPPTSHGREEAGVEYSVEEGKHVDWKATPEYFAIEDENAAICLARNAMGGTRRGLFLGIQSVPAPLCRDAVDDTTIMVVFFDKAGEKKEEAKKESRWWWSK